VLQEIKYRKQNCEILRKIYSKNLYKKIVESKRICFLHFRRKAFIYFRIL